MIAPVKFSRSVIALALVVGSGTGYAQRAEADVEFQRGRTLMAQGNTAQACAAFEASMALEAQRGTLYNLAICHDKLGKLATAWSEFVELARTDTNAARAKDAKQRAQALQPRLPRMRITTQDPDVTVTRNGIDVTPLIGKEAPVDPGSYKFRAQADGFESYTVEIDLPEGKTVEVEIPALQPQAHSQPPNRTQTRSQAKSRAQPSTTAATATPPLVAGEYPRDLPHRPILIPAGTVEFTAGSSMITSERFDRFGVDANASVRGRLGPLEAAAVFEAHVRSPFRDNKPNPWESVGAIIRYPVDPTFVVGGAFVEHQPLRSERRGSDVSAMVERKLLVYPNVAVDGQAGVMFSQRGDDDELIVNGAGQVQLTVYGPVSVAGAAALRFNLGGRLYDYTTGLDVAALALWSIAPTFDLFAQAGSSLLPDSVDHTYSVGASWRTR